MVEPLVLLLNHAHCRSPSANCQNTRHKSSAPRNVGGRKAFPNAMIRSPGLMRSLSELVVRTCYPCGCPRCHCCPSKKTQTRSWNSLAALNLASVVSGYFPKKWYNRSEERTSELQSRP